MTLYIVSATIPEWDTTNKQYHEIWDDKDYAETDYELQKKKSIYSGVYLSVVIAAHQYTGGNNK
jgi:hypothetical protein